MPEINLPQVDNYAQSIIDELKKLNKNQKEQNDEIKELVKILKEKKEDEKSEKSSNDEKEISSKDEKTEVHKNDSERSSTPNVDGKILKYLQDFDGHNQKVEKFMELQGDNMKQVVSSSHTVTFYGLWILPALFIMVLIYKVFTSYLG